MDEPTLLGYKAGRPDSANGNVSASEVKVDKNMEMSYSPVHTDSEGSPSKLPPVEVIDPSARPDKVQNGTTSAAQNAEKGSETNGEDDKKKEEVKMVGTCELFRFATCLDYILMILGTLGAIVHGAALPCMIIVFGDMVDTFVDFGVLTRLLLGLGYTLEEYFTNTTVQAIVHNQTGLPYQEPPDLVGTMQTFAIYYIGIACAVIVVGYLQVSTWSMASERQTKLIRIKFFRNILRQEIGWFDTHESGELNTRLSDDVNKIREGLGDKIGTFFQWIASCLAGFIIGFIYGWKLTLVILAVSPALAFAAFIMTKLAADMTSLELKAYAKAGAVAQEVLGSIRTVVAFGGQAKECERYNKNLIQARNTGIKKSIIQGSGMGFIWLVVFGAYALGFWYGSKLIREDEYSSGKVLIVFFSVIIGAFSLGNAGPSLQVLAAGRGAAFVVYSLIDQDPVIDSSSEGGKKPDDVQGNIDFTNVHFTYPSRLETKVLNSLSFKVKVGQTVALVGSSGCGKSTTVQLLQRFYDPSEGEVRVDGLDIRMLNVRWLRQHIGVVSQEPVLFGTTIAENIRYGRLDITKAEIEEAAKQANAHNFIMELPQKYETLVGERGAQLSGGQKQRVAIARALARNPKILLLDEATSALDMESESIVQQALEKASQGRTTIVIAHRLSTVRGADVIVGIKDGAVVEQGSHEELMKIENGVYFNLVTQQTKHWEDDNLDELASFEAELEGPKSPISSKHQLKRMLSAGSVKKDEPGADKEEEEEEEKLADAPIKRIMRMNAPEWPFILCGCLAAIINGGVQPSFAVLFAEILKVWSEDQSKQEPLIMMYSLILFGLGVLSCFSMFLQGYMFGKSGENLTMRIRQLAFTSMLRQEISWYDDHKNSTGALTTRLATDASLVQGMTGVRLGAVMQALANMGTALVIAFVYGWKLSLVILAFLPAIAIAGFLEMKILTGVGGKDKDALEGAGKVATEAVVNIRTVAALTREETFHKLYISKVQQPYKAALRKGQIYGLAFGFSQAIIFFAYAAAFYYGAILIRNGEMEYGDVFMVFSAIVFGAMGLGQASAFAPDYSKAKTSAARIFGLFDREPEIDSSSEQGEKLAPGSFESAVTFTDVKFNYPSRPGVAVLQGLNISVNPGQTLALVGSSGCGKSTSVALVERFYDPLDGQVYLDKYQLKDLNVQWLRQQIGMVSQEPVLFDCSIAENIAYGDNTRKVQMDEIIKAARDANIHNFIQSLPNGYETSAGDKGTQLSGGQKQRVAIARALLRNPKILLLDEATSALDTESEKVVQEALDQARQGRTCIVIAHRLSTIQNADKICVIHHGHVVEEGVHSELMAKQGFYYKLQKIQGGK